MVPTSRRVGSLNFGGGQGQLAFRARMLMIRASFVLLLCLTNTSALGRPGFIATKPASSRASSMRWTKGQLEVLCGGVRASARSSPPGAAVIQISVGMSTVPAGPMPLDANCNAGSGEDGL